MYLQDKWWGKIHWLTDSDNMNNSHSWCMTSMKWYNISSKQHIYLGKQDTSWCFVQDLLTIFHPKTCCNEQGYKEVFILLYWKSSSTGRMYISTEYIIHNHRVSTNRKVVLSNLNVRSSICLLYNLDLSEPLQPWRQLHQPLQTIEMFTIKTEGWMLRNVFAHGMPQ